MSEKRFIVENDNNEVSIKDKVKDNYPFALAYEHIDDADNLIQECLSLVDVLNEQSDIIEGLILDRYRQEEKLDIARRNLSKQLEKIGEQQSIIEQLRKIGVMFQGHNPCSNCTYCLEDKLCCGISPPILCDEMKKDYFVYGLCKKHKQIQKSIRRYGD